MNKVIKEIDAVLDRINLYEDAPTTERLEKNLREWRKELVSERHDLINAVEQLIDDGGVEDVTILSVLIERLEGDI